jgi:hypothetical protein
MDINQQTTPEQGNILSRVKRGMQVYDGANKRVGKVDGVFMGEVTPLQNDLGKGAATSTPRDNPGTGSIVEDFAKGLAPDDEVPDVIKERMRREGYITIDGSGFFDHDYFALHDQIGRVDTDKIWLKVRKDELIEQG